MDSNIKYIKATELNRGKASSYLKDIHDNNNDAIVLKNSEPYAVIISMEKYNEFRSMEKRLLEYESKVANYRKEE